MMKTKFYKFRVFQRMIISIALVVVVFYLMGLANNAYSRRTLSDDIIRSLSTQNNFFADQLEREVQSLLLSQMNLNNDDNLLDLYVKGELMSPYQKMHVIRELSGKLASIKRLHNIVDNLTVYFPGILHTVSSNFPIYDVFENKDLSNGKDPYEYTADGKIYLTTRYPVLTLNDESRQPAFYTRAIISRARLQDVLRQMLGTTEGRIFLFNMNGKEIASTDKAFVLPEEIRKDIFSIRNEKQNFYTSKSGFACYTAIESMGLEMIYFLPPETVESPLRIFMYLNIGLTMLMIVLLTAYGSYMNQSFIQPFLKILGAMANSSGTDNLVKENEKDEFSIIYHRYNHMVTRMDLLIHENYEAKYQAHMAELRQLQSQIRPHFLYNSIFLIYRMAKMEKNSDIAKYSHHLGSYYQYITHISDNKAALSQEIEHVMHYLDIQKTRFGNRILVYVDPVPPEIKDYLIVPLVLQPLVENAYEHGLENMTENGELFIRMDYREGMFSFTVEDNGPGMTKEDLERLQQDMLEPEPHAEAHGLVNTNLRLRLHYGSESGLKLSNRPDGGFSVSIHIKLEGGKDFV